MKIIAIHSFKRGTGKSFLVSNLAYSLAKAGKRVGMVDVAFLSPSLQYFLDVKDEPGVPLTSFIADLSEYSLKIINLTSRFTQPGFGTLHLVSLENYSAETKFVAPRFWKGINNLGALLKWDTVIMDTSSGVDEKTLLLLALADEVLITLRFDRQDYSGTAVLMDMIKKLGNESLSLVLTQITEEQLDAHVMHELQEIFGCPVAAALPFSEEVLEMGSAGLFVQKFPESAIAGQLRLLEERLL